MEDLPSFYIKVTLILHKIHLKYAVLVQGNWLQWLGDVNHFKYI